MLTNADELRSHVLQLLSPVCAPLHDHLEAASLAAVEHFRKHGIPLGDWQQTHLTRAHMHALVRKAPLPRLDLVEPCINGRLMFASPDGTLRLLHGRRGNVPAPGKNYARLRYYQQQQLEIPFGLSSALLGIWWTYPDGSVAVRVVRPVGKWKFGAPAKIDLDLLLPRTSEDFEELAFHPDDTGLELELPTREVAAEEAEEVEPGLLR